MDKLTAISEQIASLYDAKGVSLRLVREGATFTAWYVEPDQTRRASSVLDNNARRLVNRDHHWVGMRYGLPHGGAILAISEQRMTDAEYRPLILESRKLYGELARKLGDIRVENLSAPMGPDEPGETLTARFAKKARTPKPKPSKRERIQEALDGLATPDDVQPEESLRALFRAMRDSGLLNKLPAAGIKWHIPANKHSITFLRDKVPVLQLNLADLNDEKTLTQTLLSLEAMSTGEAPQANEVTADYIKNLASKVRDKERMLQQLAAKHAPKAVQQAMMQPQQAQQAISQPTVVAPAPKAAAPAGKPNKPAQNTV
jgi:hypothetical protein